MAREETGSAWGLPTGLGALIVRATVGFTVVSVSGAQGGSLSSLCSPCIDDMTHTHLRAGAGAAEEGPEAAIDTCG